jgi:GH15 family glucan-1,4-alpha-glucosidase
MDLVKKSIAVLTLFQHREGSFPACPNFPIYYYSWLRDGTFCAYALDLAGEHQSSLNFYIWLNNTLSRHLYKLEELAGKIKIRQHQDDDFLHTRYTLAGEEGLAPWGNFQLDGYGTYLWGLIEHTRITGSSLILNKSARVVKSVIGYLQQVWQENCLDCWEENKGIHPSTLAAIYGGLKAVLEFYPEWVDTKILEELRLFTINNFSNGVHFTKLKNTIQVDANLLWLGVPFGLVEPTHPLMETTVGKITTDLQMGGLYRYWGDTYYGGGEWVLLTAWLGWYYVLVGEKAKAKSILNWVEEQADAFGLLPEQVIEHVQNKAEYNRWVNRWGEIAKPLLWSHAMHLILAKSIEAVR